MINPNPQTPPGKAPLFPGALAWLAFAMLAVAVRGVRWEETYEHALVITRTVPYPEGHPFYIYARNIFSGQSYLAALLLTFFDAPAFLNGLRNVLQLAFATIPVFLLGARLGGRPFHGHVSVVFVLLGVHQGFQSYYPIETWPHFYAVGQIGAGYAMLVLACMLNGWRRTTWFLLGLMPAVHIGQWPIIAAVAGLQLIWHAWRGGPKPARPLRANAGSQEREHEERCGPAAAHERGREPIRQAAAYFALGLAPCLLFFLVQRTFTVPLPADGAYSATGDAHAIWAAYSEQYDIHRFTPRLNPFWKSALGAALVLVLLLCGTGGTRGEGRGPFHWAGLFALAASLAAGAIWLIQQALGASTPFLLIGWMPYRLLNHLAVLLVPVAVAGLLAGNEKNARAGQILAGLAMAYAALYPLWAALLPDELYQRYAGNPEGLLFALCGAAAVRQFITIRAMHAPALMWTAPPALAVFIALALGYPFGATAVTAGAAAWVALDQFAPRAKGAIGYPQTRHRLVTAAAALLLASLLWGQWRGREHLPSQPIHAEVGQYLAGRGEDDAMLVTPYWDVGWLGKTRHPIFADYQTAHLMTYMPPLAPALKKMHGEVYGFTLDGETGPPLAPWKSRTREEWQVLGKAYGFQYILAPAEMRLPIAPVLRAHPYHLYRVAP